MQIHVTKTTVGFAQCLNNLKINATRLHLLEYYESRCIDIGDYNIIENYY